MIFLYCFQTNFGIDTAHNSLILTFPEYPRDQTSPRQPGAQAAIGTPLFYDAYTDRKMRESISGFQNQQHQQGIIVSNYRQPQKNRKTNHPFMESHLFGPQTKAHTCCCWRMRDRMEGTALPFNQIPESTFCQHQKHSWLFGHYFHTLLFCPDCLCSDLPGGCCLPAGLCDHQVNNNQ